MISVYKITLNCQSISVKDAHSALELIYSSWTGFVKKLHKYSSHIGIESNEFVAAHAKMEPVQILQHVCSFFGGGGGVGWVKLKHSLVS
jgi:hypothetical protein